MTMMWNVINSVYSYMLEASRLAFMGILLVLLLCVGCHPDKVQLVEL